MLFRVAIKDDIEAMHEVRMSVSENKLNNPLLVTIEDYLRIITTDGKGWVCTIKDQLVGFAIIDVSKRNVWALFVHPDWEAKGIGKRLHNKMAGWYFEKFTATLWLTTATGTRAEKFYRSLGWKYTGEINIGESRFEMSSEKFIAFQSSLKPTTNTP